MEMSVHVETAGLASTPASRFCIAGIGSGQLRSSVGDRRRFPYVDSGALACVNKELVHANVGHLDEFF